MPVWYDIWILTDWVGFLTVTVGVYENSHWIVDMQQKLHGLSDVSAFYRCFVAFQDLVRNVTLRYPSELARERLGSLGSGVKPVEEDFMDALGSGLCTPGRGRVEKPLIMFPVGWSSGMQKVYLALESNAMSERYVSEERLRWWTGLSLIEVRQHLRMLLVSGQAYSIEGGTMWRVGQPLKRSVWLDKSGMVYSLFFIRSS